MTPDDERTRETLVAQIGALRALVERQRLYIGSMRASRFWQVRDRVFAFASRFGVRGDPLPVATGDELALTAAALGDEYQLFRLRTRRSDDDVAWLRGLMQLLALREPIDLIVDARAAGDAAIETSLASIRAQIYPHVNVHVLRAAGDLTPGTAAAIGHIAAGDLLEPDALLLVAIELHGGADLVYTDEDRLRPDGVCDAPRFKPDWSPETMVTRDYVGQLSVVRRTVLDAAGGVSPLLGTAAWYDALLRVSERSQRIVHVPRVLYHRAGSVMTTADQARAVSAALARAGETATLEPRGSGLDVRFAVPADERVTVIIPTRDRAALLDTCLTSLFERTDHPAFDAIVVDNGSVERATRELFARWTQREPQRFRVIRDDGPFNYSRLNNAAVRSTDAPYVLLLNNDTEVIAPEWMTAMLGQARRPGIGAVGALLLYADGSVQHAGVMLGGVLGAAGHAYRGLRYDERALIDAFTLDTNYLAVTGACLLVARRRFDEVGGLDETFAVAFNDIDLCLRLRAAGYRNVVVPRARLYHYESKSRGIDDTRAKQARAAEEFAEIRRRWPAWAKRDPYYNPNLTLAAEDFAVRG